MTGPLAVDVAVDGITADNTANICRVHLRQQHSLSVSE